MVLPREGLARAIARFQLIARRHPTQSHIPGRSVRARLAGTVIRTDIIHINWAGGPLHASSAGIMIRADIIHINRAGGPLHASVAGKSRKTLGKALGNAAGDNLSLVEAATPLLERVQGHRHDGLNPAVEPATGQIPAQKPSRPESETLVAAIFELPYYLAPGALVPVEE